MTSDTMTLTRRRLFLILDPQNRMLVDTCSGPTAAGECPQAVDGAIPCSGMRVLPVHGTEADGFPTYVAEQTYGGCPLAWICRDEPYGD